MAGEKDPFRAAEAQAKQQQHEREAEHGQQQPTTADYEKYDEEVGDKVEGTGGASAGGPAI
jgi:hypothetical protein